MPFQGNTAHCTTTDGERERGHVALCSEGKEGEEVLLLRYGDLNPHLLVPETPRRQQQRGVTCGIKTTGTKGNSKRNSNKPL